MIHGATGRAVSRLIGLLALTGLMVGCAGTSHGPAHAPADFGKDQASRANRLVGYCERLAGEGKFLTALGLCARAYELYPEDPETLMKIAALLQTLDRDDAAAETYTTLLAQHPGYHEAMYSLGKVHMEAGRFDQASIQFNRAMIGNPEDPRPYNALGIIRDQSGEHQAAQALYRSALEQDPENMPARNNLGLSLALNGNRDEAIEVLAGAAVEPGADETVLHNLEAAYATMSVALPSDGQAPSEPLPATPDLVPQAINRPAVPVVVEPLENSTLEDGGLGNSPLKDAVDGEGPIPLFAPSTAGDGDQTSALPARELHAVEVAPAVETGEPRSVIAAAATRLQEPPDWAAFEPGDLLSALPSADPRDVSGNQVAAVSEEIEPVATEPQSSTQSVAAIRGGADPYYLSLLVTKVQ